MPKSIVIEPEKVFASQTIRFSDIPANAYHRSIEQERAVEIYLDCDIAPGAEPWFEEAIDCCAFLVWRLSQQGAGIRFQTQEFQIRVPEEGDVYTILKYLALVCPLQGKAPEPPIDEQSFQIVFSSDPNGVEAAGWTPARLLRPGDSALGVDS